MNLKNPLNKKPPRRRRKKSDVVLTGEKKTGEKRINVAPGIWILSKRKAAVVRAEYLARKEQELADLKFKTPKKISKADHGEKMTRRYQTQAGR